MKNHDVEHTKASFDDRAILGPSTDVVQDSRQWVNLTREDVLARVNTIERDLEDMQTDGEAMRLKVTAGAMSETRREVRDLHAQLDDLSAQAPDALGEIQDAVGAALRKLEDSYQRAVGIR